LAALTGIFRGFPQSVQANAGILTLNKLLPTSFRALTAEHYNNLPLPSTYVAEKTSLT
jgi:hypothetical protein